MIDPQVYEELRKDRDKWQREAGWLKHVNHHLEKELAAARRRTPVEATHSHKRQVAEVVFQNVVSRGRG